MKFDILKILLCILIIDFVYLKLISNHFNNLFIKIQRKPITLKYLPILLCYLLLSFVYYYFIDKDNKSALDAFLLGLSIYGIYDTTNMATFNKWGWDTVLLDTLWGGTLFALTHKVLQYI